MDGVGLTLVETVDDLVKFFDWLGQRRDWLAIDVETDGLRWWDGKLRLVQFGDEAGAWALPWEWWPKAVTDALIAYEGRVVGHNIKFDMHWLARNCKGFEPQWHRTYDTMIMAHIHEPHLRTGLKEVGRRHVHANAGAGDRALKHAMAQNGWDWATVPIEHPAYWGYACIDTVLTARLAAKLHPIVSAERRAVLDLENQVQAVLWRMEERGAVIDRDYTSETSKRFAQRAAQLATWADATYGVNIGSNQQTISKMIEMGGEFTKLTERGAIALDDEVLLALIRDGSGPLQELAQATRTHRKLKKLVSAYFTNFLDLADSDGIIHPSIRQLGARTGRMSVASPSLQNLPRNEEVRSCFVAREGHKLVLSDFDQIEIRLLAHFCQDPSLIAAIMDPSVDVHTGAARMIYRDPTITKSDPRRTTTKSAVFAKVYGAGAAKFALTARISEAAASQFMADYDATFPRVPNFIGQVQAVARDRKRDVGDAYVCTPRGRRETIGQGDEFYKLVNYLIQGTAADVMKSQIVALDAAGLGEFMVLPVHDEIILDVPNDLVDDVSAVIEREMPVPAGPYTVPLTSDLAVADRWGDKYTGGSSWLDEAFSDVFAEEIADT